MSFTPLSRVKNYTLDSLKLFLDIFKLIPSDSNSENGQNFCEEKLKGFIKSYYQVAAQMGIYNHYAPKFSYHKYLLDFSDYDLRKYLSFWFKIYYAPNKYVQSDDSSIIIYVELVKELLTNGREINLDDFFSQKIGGKSYDIFINALKRYCPELTYSIKNDVKTISISQDDIDEIKKEIDFIEKYFPIPEEYNNPNVFFERFNYENFCKFYEINKSDSIQSAEFAKKILPAKSCQQIIYYGVPGSGKSHKIDNELETKIPDKNQREQQVMRVVFHPEYTNADFVGQILPVLDSSGVNYKFKAGPFTRILKRALKNPSLPYYLIIEEINRGNAAAIFGDLFQLLDRNSDGWSSYPIENFDINSFIRCKNDSYNDEKEIESTVRVGNLDFTENTGIRLPPNLSILATMNTSDQNVFTLDNAFQRRWNMKLVENTFGSGSENQKNALLENSKVTWEKFQSQINKKISEAAQENNLSSMVDKRLGCWFVKASEDKEGKFISPNFDLI